MPRVTIGIPIFNEQQYIAGTVQSALIQVSDFGDCEVLISDNCSNDGTILEVERVLADFKGAERCVRFVKNNENLGGAVNFWRTFDDSDSEFFLCLGGHDRLLGAYVKLGMDHLMESKETSIFCGAHAGIGPNGEPVGEPKNYDFSQNNPAERYLRSIRDLTNCYIFQSIFRRDYLQGFARPDVPSMDHIVISRWLWFGKLFQSNHYTYLRRYFGQDELNKKASSDAYVSLENNVSFYEAYLADLQQLAESLPERVRAGLINQAYNTLVSRFGLPYLAT